MHSLHIMRRGCVFHLKTRTLVGPPCLVYWYPQSIRYVLDNLLAHRLFLQELLLEDLECLRDVNNLLADLALRDWADNVNFGGHP